MVTDLLTHLQSLEIVLHQPSVRRDASQLNGLLHEAFVEFGGSGRVYHKTEILRQLAAETAETTIWSDSFALTELADGVALLTYRSGHLNEEGQRTRYTLRSSLWQRTETGWQMRFHQGTATDETG